MPLLVVRHPMEVASSLHTREDRPIYVGLALWQLYSVALLRELAGLRAIAVHYENLVSDPERTVPLLIKELKQALPAEAAQLISADDRAVAFLSDRRRHQRVTSAASSAEQMLTNAQSDLWHWLRDLPDGSLDIDPPNRLQSAPEVARTAVADYFAHASQRVSTVEALAAEHRRALQLEQTATTQERRIDALEQQLRRQLYHALQLALSVEIERRRSQDVRADRDAQVEQLRAEVSGVADRLKDSTALLQREETTVLKPIARRVVRGVRAQARRLPPEWQDTVRATLLPLARRVAPASAEALAYQQARRRRHGRARLRPQIAEHANRDLLVIEDDAFWRDYLDLPDRLTFVFFPVIDWHFRFQRPQQLARALGAQGHKVLYLTTDFSPEPKAKPYEVIESPVDNVYLCRLACPPPHPRLYESLLTSRQLEVVSTNLAALLDKNAGSPIIRVVQHPFWARLMKQVDVGPLVYDMMDEHSEFLGNGDWIDNEEQRLLKLADLITVTADSLQKRTIHPQNTMVLKNAADFDHFASIEPRQSNAHPVRLGYYGAISYWFDAGLVAECAKAHPEWEFELVGSTFQADLSKLAQFDNVTMFGEQDYDQLLDHLRGWDVALIPFKDVPLTRATNPVKAYEYLSAGKPVVATRLPELEPFSEWIGLASTAGEFVHAVEEAQALARDADLAAARKNAIRQETWTERATRLAQRVGERPLVSVVVLCYGQLALTKKCIRSLLIRTSYPDWELVIVDNNSPDGTAEWIQNMATHYPRIRAVLSADNLGFSGGNNLGVRASRGRYIVLLNNDTVVTPGWLGRLVRHLEEDEDMGLVGPVTNGIGNEAYVEVNYEDDESMLVASRQYTSAHFRELLYVDNVAFFAVGFRRSTWERTGELDEGFGLGFFEDDDYCHRVRQAGMKIGIAEDVYVHHELSASFDKLPAGAKQAQFEKSRRRFEEKWGPWVPHRYRQEGAQD